MTFALRPRFFALTLALGATALVACAGTSNPAEPPAEDGASSPQTCEYEGAPFAEGQTFPSSDGCNTCSCSGGAVACTEKACLPALRCGARAGDTCAPDEYCAYAPGQWCGQADAEATCNGRPTACDSVRAPVCGCDSVTYDNSCMANLAGTGVLSEGPCAPSP